MQPTERFKKRRCNVQMFLKNPLSPTEFPARTAQTTETSNKAENNSNQKI